MEARFSHRDNGIRAPQGPQHIGTVLEREHPHTQHFVALVTRFIPQITIHALHWTDLTIVFTCLPLMSVSFDISRTNN